MKKTFGYPEGIKMVPGGCNIRNQEEHKKLKLEEEESAYIDIAGSGVDHEISCSFDRDEYDSITGATFVLDGEEYHMSDLQIYDAELYLVRPALSGAVYLYIDGLSDNDYHYTTIVGFGPDTVWYAGDFSGGFAEEPTDVEAMRLAVRQELLTSVTGTRTYRVGISGLPEAVEPYFRTRSEIRLTTKQEIDSWIVAPDTGEMIDTVTIPAGETVKLLRTDGKNFWDVVLETGDCRRVFIDADGWPHTIGGVDIEACFDGIMFAG